MVFALFLIMLFLSCIFLNFLQILLAKLDQTNSINKNVKNKNASELVIDQI